MSIHISLKHGLMFPYDGSDAWSEDPDNVAKPEVRNWAHAAALGVIANLTDRRGIKHEFGNIDEDVRIEIVQTLSDIIEDAERTRK